MREALPVIRVTNASGDLVVREGLVLCFFMRHSHRDVAAGVWRALEHYRRAIPPQALGWYGADDGDTLPLDEAGWKHIREQMVERAWGIEWLVELSEFESGAGGYHFEYDGRKLDAPLFDQDDGATSGICFSFPTEYLLSHGPGHFRALALDIARELPFSFGYASLALNCRPGAWFSVRRQLLDTLSRYLGLDIHHMGETSRHIGTKARGAYWLTFLGEPLLAQLGGLESLQQRLGMPELSFQRMASERVLLTLGEWPDAIDTETQSVPVQYRELARVLEPFLGEEKSSWPPFDTAMWHRWLRRLCP
ncbi:MULTISPECIES: type VI immunity family protein [unclassified Myxococcus]|uniref:type VI immunity family protein n=1 Tax=unclassified Myxococcus TaxID=2648731 RepID=UPI0020C60312|nr:MULTISPECIES: type VI immunity family protein [unclassified Myxococcus]